MKRKTGAAILALLFALAVSPGARAAGGSAARTTASNSPTSAATASAGASMLAKEREMTAGSPCRGADTLPTRSDLVFVDSATTCLIDRERARYGLRRLQPNRYLQKVAVGQASDMVSGDYFGDDSLSGMTPIQRIAVSHYAWRVRSLAAGQNIGWGTGALATPRAMVEGWMSSPPHRQIILTAGYRDIGAGIAASTPSSLSGGVPGATYSVEFGARR